MHISALYLVCNPDLQNQVREQITQLAWAEPQLEESSKFILTLEAADEKDAEQKVRHLEGMHGVILAQVTGFYSN